MYIFISTIIKRLEHHEPTSSEGNFSTDPSKQESRIRAELDTVRSKRSLASAKLRTSSISRTVFSKVGLLASIRTT
ncbi:hypothetical protein VTI74DRAFT_3121 [Chaetomium olivicolor]